MTPEEQQAQLKEIFPSEEAYEPDEEELLLLAKARQRMAQSQNAPSSNKVSAKEEIYDPSTTIRRTMLDQGMQGVPLVGSFLDEPMSDFGALLASAYLNYKNTAPKFLGGDPGAYDEALNTEQLFTDARKQTNERLKAQLKERPALSISSQLASGIFGGGALLKSAGATPAMGEGSKYVADVAAKVNDWIRSGSKIRQAGKAVAAGVPAAALYGAGAGEDGARLESAMQTAPFGVIPAAIPLGSAAIKKGSEVLVPAVRNASSAVLPSKAPIVATDKILQRLADDNMTLEGVASRLAKAPAGSALVDVGRSNVERLAEAAATMPGEAANKAVRFVSKRASAEPKNIKSAINQFISSGDAVSTADRIMKEADEAVAPLYKEVYSANPSIASKEIDRILSTPAGSSALKKAAELMQNDRKLVAMTDPELLEQARLVGMHIPGGVASGLKMETLDYVKRALGDMEKAARGTNEGRIMGNLRRDLTSALDEADVSGKYKETRQIWAGAMSGQEALEKGADILKMDSSELKKYFNALGEHEKELFRLGAAQALRDTVSSTPDRTNMARKIFGRDEYRQNLQAILPREDFNKLRAALMRQEKQHLMSGRMLGNSRTAMRLAEQQDLGTMDPQAAAALLSGDTSGFVLGRLKNTLQNYATGINRNTAGDITSMLLETDPIKQKQVLARLKAAEAAKAAKGRKALQVNVPGYISPEQLAKRSSPLSRLSEEQ